MNCTRLAAIVMMFAVSAYGATHESAALSVNNLGKAGLSLECRFPSPGEASSTLDKDVVLTYDEGGRAVPTLSKLISVPEGCIPQVEVTRRVSFTAADDGSMPVQLQPAELTAKNLWPPQPVAIGRTEILRGIPVASLSIYQLQLDDRDAGVENREVELKVTFVPSPNAPAPHPINEHPNTITARFIDKLLLNPPSRDTDTPPEEPVPYLDHILIAFQADVPANSRSWIDSLATWKRQLGYKVSLMAVDLNAYNDMRQFRDSVRINYYEPPVEDPISHLIIIGSWVEGAATYFPICPGFIPERTGDHYFSLMDLNDRYLSDITVGRFWAISQTEFAGEVKRSIFYERTPLTNAPEWFSHALYTAENINVPGGNFVPSMYQLGRWIFSRWQQMGYSPIDTMYTGSSPDSVQVIADRTTALLEGGGLSVLISRGWAKGTVPDMPREVVARTGRRNPFVMAITCLSFEIQSIFFRKTQPGGANGMTGPIADFCINGLTHSRTNNGLMGGQVRGMRYFDLNQPGLIQNFSKVQLVSDYPDQGVDTEVQDLLAEYELLGDPTADIFTRYPDTLTAIHPDWLSIGATGVNVQVRIGDQVKPDAKVCVMQGDNIHLVAAPGADGVARFTFTPGELRQGSLLLTISSHNCIPYLYTIPVRALGQNDTGLVVTEIRDNGRKAGGDTLQVTFNLTNPGPNVFAGGRVAFSSESPWVSFVPDMIDIGRIPVNNGGAVQVGVAINRSAPAGLDIRLDANIMSGNQSNSNAYNFTTTGARLYTIRIDGDVVRRNRPSRLRPQVRNGGSAASVSCTATLAALNDHVTVTDPDATYGVGNANGGDAALTGDFSISLDSLVVPGNPLQFELRLRASNQADPFRDTLKFTIIPGERAPTDPLGPDKYGYYCFDNTDATWPKRPTFGWREINPSKLNREFDGQRIDIRDFAVDHDSTIVVRLPFEFRYYGQAFRDLAICSNGWVAFGADKSMFIDFRNYQMPGVQGPDAMLAAFWDDLVNPNNNQHRGIFTGAPAGEGVFIIEYSEMEVAEDWVNHTLQEFEIVLYDPAVWPTRTGDGDIKFQYKHIGHSAGPGTDNFYSTVGIKNLDGSDGITVNYWRQALGNQSLVGDSTALLFTTDLAQPRGNIAGKAVLAADTTHTLSGVSVRTSGGQTATTDQNGEFSLTRLPAGNYTVYFSLPGYNTVAVAAQITADQTARVRGLMTRPGVRVDEREVTQYLQPGGFGNVQHLTIHSTGDGPLEYSVSRRYADGSKSTFPRLMNRAAGDLDGTNHLWGAEVVGNRIYVTSGGGAGTEDNRLLVLNTNGQRVRSHRQGSLTSQGFRDLAWDGRYLYAGEDTMVYVFDTLANPVRSFRIPNHGAGAGKIEEPWGITYDPVDSLILVGYRGSDIYKFNLNGDSVGYMSFQITGIDNNITGLAWNPADGDGMPLYVMMQNSSDGRHMWLVKTNGEKTLPVAQLAGTGSEYGTGLGIGFDWIAGKAALVTISDNAIEGGADSIRVHEIGPDTRGISYRLGRQEVGANEIGLFDLTFLSTGLALGEYQFGLVIQHNAASDSILVPVTLRITPDASARSEDAAPTNFTLDDAYPNPFNGSTRLSFGLQTGGTARLAVYDIAGREVERLVDGKINAGKYEFVWEAASLPSGIYFIRLESSGQSLTKRIILMR